MIDLQKDGGLWTATIRRPDKANSLTKAMLEQLADIAEAAVDAKVLVITGEGRVFSAGADLGEAHAGLATDPVWERLSGAVATVPCLTIAALNGTLAGGAFGMALACDLRIAVPTAKFFYPVMKLGFLPQPSDPARMRALIGPARTKMILMGGHKITADQALEFGLVDMLVSGDKMAGTIGDLAADVLEAKPEILSGIKAMCNG
ncbi:enoyl-CoA hydratase/isomerase family protein [Profundibacter sp.]|uniref:enoyl-CoA hydratase/isomerase family protein n=1 Tax=Profundibacter sp. TaxID=3101071 RepID=UPI003D10F1F7